MPLAQRFAQDEWEFAQMCRHLEGAKSVLEIGSRYGESLRRMAKHVPFGRLVAVDLGKDPFSPPEEDIATPLMETITSLCAVGHDARLVLGNSRDPTVIEHVRELGPYDFVFIDGDHSYAGVQEDWRNYGPMGKVVALHDVNYGKPGHDGAKILWTQIAATWCHAKYIRSGLGIGVIFREEEMR